MKLIAGAFNIQQGAMRMNTAYSTHVKIEDPCTSFWLLVDTELVWCSVCSVVTKYSLLQTECGAMHCPVPPCSVAISHYFIRSASCSLQNI